MGESILSVKRWEGEEGHAEEGRGAVPPPLQHHPHPGHPPK